LVKETTGILNDTCVVTEVRGTATDGNDIWVECN